MVRSGGLDFVIVDDDPIVSEVMARRLKAASHRVRQASSADAGLGLIAAAQPDCLIVDIMMPQQDGLEFCRSLRSRPDMADLKIIVVSSKSYEFDRRRARAAGAAGFIQKPVGEDFADRVAAILADRIELRYWGLRGTLPVPSMRAMRYGGNTACITMSFGEESLFIFDAGTGIKELSNALLARRTRLTAKLFISHPHWDHINALPYFVPLYIQGNEFEVLGPTHGDQSIRRVIADQMDGIYFPVTVREFAAHILYRDLREETLTVDGAQVQTMLLAHPGYCLGYRVGYNGRTFCYVTDNELFLEDSPHYDAHYARRLADFVRGADVLVTDTTYTDEGYKTKVGWGHSCIGEVAKLAAAAEVRELHLFHHDPDQADTDIDAKLDATRRRLEELGSKVVCRAPAEGDRVVI